MACTLKTMQSILRSLAPPCVLALLLFANCSAFAPKSARKITLRDLNGGKVRMAEYQGQIVVLNFWAT